MHIFSLLSPFPLFSRFDAGLTPVCIMVTQRAAGKRARMDRSCCCDLSTVQRFSPHNKQKSGFPVPAAARNGQTEIMHRGSPCGRACVIAEDRFRKSLTLSLQPIAAPQAFSFRPGWPWQHGQAECEPRGQKKGECGLACWGGEAVKQPRRSIFAASGFSQCHDLFYFRKSSSCAVGGFLACLLSHCGSMPAERFPPTTP